jgi:hypothetical protein
LADHFFSPLGAPKWPREKIFAKRDHEQKETKETKIVGLAGKKLCSLGYLLFRVCWGALKPHEEKIKSAKNDKGRQNSHQSAVPAFFWLCFACLADHQPP